MKRSQVNVSSNLQLSADSDDDEEEEEMPKAAVEKPSPAPDTVKKNSIKSRIFGPMLSKGREGGKGKGKGKGGNNGGITVVYKEEEDTNVARDKPGSPQLTSPARASPSRPRASPALKDSRESSSRSSPVTRDSRELNGVKDHTRDHRAGGAARRDSRDVDSKSSPAVEREKVPVMRDSRVNRE